MLFERVSAIAGFAERGEVGMGAGIRSQECQDYADKLEGAFHVGGSRVVVGGVRFVGVVTVETNVKRGVAVYICGGGEAEPDPACEQGEGEKDVGREGCRAGEDGAGGVYGVSEDGGSGRESGKGELLRDRILELDPRRRVVEYSGLGGRKGVKMEPALEGQLQV